MKNIIDNLFTVSYLIFGLFLILVGIKDSAIYYWESVGLILIGGGLTVCATQQMSNLMNGDSDEQL